ncbi:MAG: hypothetical protein KDA99_11320, partial [Planctomycetales bacterium]|nr:hypothetical protein [Planctomycetales bacterium]
MRKWLRSRFTHNRWVFHTALFPILGGPMRGLRWSCVSGGKLLRVLRGTYEVKQTQLVWQALGAGDTFIDVGAHHGYYTMLASRAVGSNGMVMAFEPDPRNAFLLRGHVHANAL